MTQGPNKPIRKAVFPVAGLGTRFLPATKAIPKEMQPIIDRPLIQYAVDEAREAGIEQLIFVTGRGKTAVRNMMPMQMGDVPGTWADTSLIQRLTGYKPHTDYREGVAQFVAWYREYYEN